MNPVNRFRLYALSLYAVSILLVLLLFIPATGTIYDKKDGGLERMYTRTTFHSFLLYGNSTEISPVTLITYEPDYVRLALLLGTVSLTFGSVVMAFGQKPEPPEPNNPSDEEDMD